MYLITTEFRAQMVSYMDNQACSAPQAITKQSRMLIEECVITLCHRGRFGRQNSTV